MVEVNPLVVTEDNQVIALDAKMSVDDNALFRHKDVAEMRDPNEEDPAELEAKEHGMAFVKLDGNIGCLVNGAGLAMATMDAIATYGEEQAPSPPTSSTLVVVPPPNRCTHAFKLILKDDSVEAILVNIFGGIMKCDVIAEGVLTAVRKSVSTVHWWFASKAPMLNKVRKLIAESDLKSSPPMTSKMAAAKAAAAASNTATRA